MSIVLKSFFLVALLGLPIAQASANTPEKKQGWVVRFIKNKKVQISVATLVLVLAAVPVWNHITEDDPHLNNSHHGPKNEHEALQTVQRVRQINLVVKLAKDNNTNEADGSKALLEDIEKSLTDENHTIPNYRPLKRQDSNTKLPKILSPEQTVNWTRHMFYEDGGKMNDRIRKQLIDHRRQHPSQWDLKPKGK